MKKQSILIAGAALVAVFVIVIAGVSVWQLLKKTPPVTPPSPKPPLSYDLGGKAQFIKITSPLPGQKLVSPLTITGEARLWYFEGSFPVVLKDANGKVLASGPAQAKGDWMNENFVPFAITLNFSQPTTPTGTLTFKKDNPSGLPANDDQAVVTVTFASANPVATCHPSGCSGQICSDQDAITDCLYLPQYACYKNATCARQSDGKCGWAPTPDLKVCLDKASKANSKIQQPNSK
jgi:hypothetical protein